MAIETGRLGPLTLPALIQRLCGQKKTGSLMVTDEPIRKVLYFDSGQIVFASSTDPEDRLGHLYLRRGMITLAAHSEGLRVANAQGKRLGTVLVQMKAIRPQDLVWGVTEQVKLMVISLFQWTRGDGAFRPGKPLEDEVITLKMPTADLVLTGIKSIESWSRIEAAVGDMSARFRTTPRLQSLAEELSLSLDEWTLLSRCESGATLGQICDDSALGDFEVCRLIWAFVVVGLLERVGQTAVASAT